MCQISKHVYKVIAEMCLEKCLHAKHCFCSVRLKRGSGLAVMRLKLHTHAAR